MALNCPASAAKKQIPRFARNDNGEGNDRNTGEGDARNDEPRIEPRLIALYFFASHLPAQNAERWGTLRFYVI